MRAGGLEQAERSDDIGLDEDLRTVDGSVDMAFGGQVHQHIDRFLAQQLADRRLVADVGLDETVILLRLDGSERCQISGIGQLVDIDDPVVGVGGQTTTERRTDETGPAGDEKVHSSVL